MHAQTQRSRATHSNCAARAASWWFRAPEQGVVLDHDPLWPTCARGQAQLSGRRHVQRFASASAGSVAAERRARALASRGRERERARARDPRARAARACGAAR
eukprot:1083715-Pleurochrysis_carterae.AAC.1